MNFAEPSTRWHIQIAKQTNQLHKMPLNSSTVADAYILARATLFTRLLESGSNLPPPA